MVKRFQREKNISQTHTKNSSKTFKKNHDGDVLGVHDSVKFLGSSIPKYKKVYNNSRIKKWVLLTIIVGFLFFVAGIIFPKLLLYKISDHSFFKIFSNTSQQSAEETVQKGIDILALGRGGDENDAPDLTDTIILVHINGEKNSVTTVSIPRDLYVDSSILGKVKINEVYPGVKKSQGHDIAVNHLMDIVSQVTGRNIDLYSLIDFAGFRKLIDVVGGIEIDVVERLYDPEYPTKNWGYTVVDIPAGVQLFDGDKALKFVRSRHTTSDFDRSYRQQMVINALREKLLKLDIVTSPKKIEELYAILSDSIQTNLSLKDILFLTKNFKKIADNSLTSYALHMSCFEAIRLCDAGGLLYNPERSLYNGLSVLLPKKASPSIRGTYEHIHQFIRLVFGFPDISSYPGLGVVNASGKTQLALHVALKLKSLGVPINDAQLRNQKEKVEKTFIRYNPSIIQPDHTLFAALKPLFSGSVQAATEEELVGMGTTTAYELVLGNDALLLFN